MNGAQIRACLEGDATYRRMYCGGLWAEPLPDEEQPKPVGPVVFPRFPNADPVGTEWVPTVPVPVADLPREAGKPFLSRLADIFDGIPDAPLGSPVEPGECPWCRVTKKASGYAAWVVVGLITAWLVKKWIRL